SEEPGGGGPEDRAAAQVPAGWDRGGRGEHSRFCPRGPGEEAGGSQASLRRRFELEPAFSRRELRLPGASLGPGRLAGSPRPASKPVGQERLRRQEGGGQGAKRADRQG